MTLLLFYWGSRNILDEGILKSLMQVGYFSIKAPGVNFTLITRLKVADFSDADDFSIMKVLVVLKILISRFLNIGQVRVQNNSLLKEWIELLAIACSNGVVQF